MPTSHLTLTTIANAPLFADFWAARALIQKMRSLEQQKALHSLAWSLVPDQLQWLIITEDDALQPIILSLEIHAIRALKPIGHQGPVWQRPNPPRLLQPLEPPRTIARHILAAPYRSGLVDRPGDHPHWDSTWL